MTTASSTPEAAPNLSNLSNHYPDTMFLAFGAEDNTNVLFMGVISGSNARRLNDWLNDVPGLPNPLPLTHVPIMRFLSNLVHDHQTASWVQGTFLAEKSTVQTWNWGHKQMLPPRPSYTNRSFQMVISTAPLYWCTGITNAGPILNLSYCDGTGGHTIVARSQIVKISDIPGSEMPRRPNYASEACHEADHDHLPYGQDDSPPPSPKRGRFDNGI